MVDNCSFILGENTDFNVDVLISQNPASDILLTIEGNNFNSYFTIADTTEVGYVKVISIRVPRNNLPFNTGSYLNYSLVFSYSNTEQAILSGLLQKRIS